MKRNWIFLFFGPILLSMSTAFSSDQPTDIAESFMPKVEAYSMPWSTPMVAPGPFKLHDNHLINIVSRSEMEVLKKLVPPPLVPNQSGLMFFYVGKLNFMSQVNEPEFYHEASISIPVTFEGKPGNYSVVLYVDKALPIVVGREIWGFPKKDAEIVYQETKDKISAQVQRFGTTIVELSADLGGEAQQVPDATSVPYITFKIIPSVEKGATPDVKQLTSVVGNETIISLRTANEVSLKYNSTTADPLGEIPVLDVVYARFTIFDTVLDYGEVLYDYLKANE